MSSSFTNNSDFDKRTMFNFGFKFLNLKELSEYTNSYKGILYQPNTNTKNGESAHTATSFSFIYGIERIFEKVNIGCELLFTNSNYCPDGLNGCITTRDLGSKFLIRFYH